MLSSPLFYVFTGGGLFVFLGLFYKLLRNPAFYWSVLLVSILLSLTGLLNWSSPELQHENGSLAALMLLPFLFTGCFGICRSWFLRFFNEEPEIPFRWKVWINWQREDATTAHVVFGLIVTFTPVIIVMLAMELF